MKILNKILAAPAAAIVCMFLLGGFAYYALNKSNLALYEIYKVRAGSQAVASNVESTVYGVHASVYRIFTWSASYDSAKMDKVSKEQFKLLTDASSSFDDWLKQPFLIEEEKTLGGKIAVSLGKYHKDIFQALDMAGTDINMGLSAMQTADTTFQDLARNIDELQAVETKLSTLGYEKFEDTYGRVLVIAAILLVAAIMISLLIGIYMARGIALPVSKAINAADKIAAGDLRNTIDSQGSDEIAHLMQALEKMQDSLRDVIRHINTTAGEVGASAVQLTKFATGISNSVNESGESVTSTAAAVEEMTTSIGQVSDNAEAARQIAQRTSDVAQQGIDRLHDASGEINKIAGAVENSSQVMKHLQSSSQQIGNIANVIRDIADQTNLLALNAAIEAARAGEQGRGFAVVADEVRKLAEKVGGATNEIKTMIESIQSQSDQAATQMQQANALAMTGVQKIQELKAPLEELQHGAVNALASLVDLAGATKEQTRASIQIAKNIEHIAQMSESDSNAAQQSATAARSLEGLAKNLLTVVNRFQT